MQMTRLSGVVLLGVTIMIAFFGFQMLPKASLVLQVHSPIVIANNQDFTTLNGVSGGSGTPSDPYVIEGWTIDGFSASSPAPRNGILITDTDLPFIIRNVHVSNSSGASGDVGAGIAFRHVSNAIIRDVTSENNEAGIQLSDVSRVVIANNTIRLNAQTPNNMAAGIIVTRGFNITISGNTVGNNVQGLYSQFSSNITISGNTFSHNIIGLPLNGGTGLSFSSCHNVTISNNNVSDNREGITLIDSAGVATYHNHFTNNGKPATDNQGNIDTWDSGYPGGGNYWSDYRGVDSCRGPNQDSCADVKGYALPDGIGDTPYVVDSNSIDHYPLMLSTPTPSFWAEYWYLTASVPTAAVVTTILLIRGHRTCKIRRKNLRVKIILTFPETELP